MVLDEAMRIVDEYQTEEIRKTVTETTAGSPEGEGSGPGAAVVNGTGGDPMVETRLTDLIYQYIRDNYMFDISMQEVARTMNYSEAYFCKLFKEITQLTPMQYVIRYRLEQSKKRLLLSDDPAETVMLEAGFHNYSYFWRVFKEIYGLSPQAYRKKYNKK